MKQTDKSQEKISLLEDSDEIFIKQQTKNFSKSYKNWKKFAFLISASIALLIMFIIQNFYTKTIVVPVKIELPWYKNKSIIMQVETSRVLEPLFYSGYDLRTQANYKSVTQRFVKWTVQPTGIITVDLYGRINAVKEGIATLTVISLTNSNVKDSRIVQVVTKRNDIDKVPQRIIKFQGNPAQPVRNLQKIVQRFTKQEILQNIQVPQTVKYAVQHLNQNLQTKVHDGDVTWQIVNYADKSDRKYVKRQNLTMEQTNRDKNQYFMGDRYISDDGIHPIMIQTDNNFGLWIVSASGNTTHVKMIQLSFSQKAQMMVEQTKKYVLRHGLAGGSNWNGTKWISDISDNDGLWTSLYGAGELMKYSVLKQIGTQQTRIFKARQSALKSLKAVLLISNVAGRQGKIMAKIRYLNNSITQGVLYCKQYLLEGKQNCRDTYVGKPTDGIGYFGIDANKVIDENYIAGQFKYSMLPLIPEDWSTQGQAAKTQRSLHGFISRTFVIDELDSPISPNSNGLFFKRHKNLTHTILSGANILYDYKKEDHPNLELGNKPVPKVLQSLLLIDGVQYNISNLIYKGDTSIDEVIGHLFIYKIAYDILSDTDQQQNQLKQLIRETMRNFCQHLINNGYMMVDATGQATRWVKLFKQFFLSDQTNDDGSLTAIQLLLSFKLAYYVTGQKKFKDQYELLAKDQKFRYIDFVGIMWDRLVWTYTNNDYSEQKLYKLDYSLNPSQTQIEKHTIYKMHFSDQQEAFLAYYLAFQLEQDLQMREKYRKGINSFWHSISKSQNPLWYYIYQLSRPEQAQNDGFGNDLRKTASWQLSRHMIDTTKFQAFIKGSRSDVIFQGNLSSDPTKIIGKRTSKKDEKYVSDPLNWLVYPEFDPKNIYEIKVLPADQRSIHKFNAATFDKIQQNHNAASMQPSTTYTLPYWFGVYHGMIKYD